MIATSDIRSATAQSAATLYLDLMKLHLTDAIYHAQRPRRPDNPMPNYDPYVGIKGWPDVAHTMVSIPRLSNLQNCMLSVHSHNVAGDFVECGVWRGGASIFMRAFLRAYGDIARCVLVCDSFEGLPLPDVDAYPQDRHDYHYAVDYLKVPLDEVKRNFAAYGLLDNQVVFWPGWFKDTLSALPTAKIAVLRLDSDMYGSTWETLTALYPKLSVGGWCIVDDFMSHPACRAAVEDYMGSHGYSYVPLPVDSACVYWQKESWS